jgi:hypothetical protein
MQPVLVDRRQLVPERLVQVIDDSGIALHNGAPTRESASRLGCSFLDYNNYKLAAYGQMRCEDFERSTANG